MKNEQIKVINPGQQIPRHSCEDNWLDKVNIKNPAGNDYMRICSVCGRTEHVIEQIETEDFDSTFRRFYGDEVI